jgi:DNA-binding CsgD family transcriptional regulator
MEKMKRLALIVSIILVSIGLLSLLLDFTLGWTVNISWPIVIIMLGVVFFILVDVLIEKWAWADMLFIPGSLLLALGLIFLLNVLTNDWNAWAYAWLLAVAALGLGLVLANHEKHWQKEVTWVGAGLIIGGIPLSVLFGAIAGGRFFQVMAPILLVLIGLSLRWLHLETIVPERFLKRFKRFGASPSDLAASTPDQKILVEPLSARELEVLCLIDQGLSNPEIAKKLTLAPSTIKTHINNIYGKLGVQTRIQAIKQGKELGLLCQ